MESVILDIWSENVTLGVEFRGDVYHQDRKRGKDESKRAGHGFIKLKPTRRNRDITNGKKTGYAVPRSRNILSQSRLISAKE